MSKAQPFLLAGLVVVLGVFSAAMVTSGDIGKGCIVVTDGTARVLRHEKAHCAGWDHEPFTPSNPPARYVDAYTGKLTVIKCGRRYECKSVQKKCKELWAQYGYTTAGYTETPGYTNFNGCSISE